MPSFTNPLEDTPTATGVRTWGGAKIIGGGMVTHSGTGPGPEVMAADTIESDSVYNHQDEKLGTIKHVMIDVLHGRVAYAVVSRGGVLGMGDKLFAIPWSALILDTEKERFLLDVSESQMEAAPGFDKNHWPRMGDLSWATDVHSHYRQTPYWE